MADSLVHSCGVSVTTVHVFSSRFQAKGMDIGVADESLNGIPYEQSSESEEEAETEETEGKINKKMLSIY